MTPTKAAKFLREYNEWRRWDGGNSPDTPGPAMPNPREIGTAIDVVCECVERMKP